jgi:L-amino acid N-acyltransferase YncA
MQITVRDATLDDVDAIVTVKTDAARRAYAAEHGGRQLDEWIKKNCTAAHYTYRISRRSQYTVLVAETDNQIVGVAVMRPRGNRADMSGLYVLTPGEGVGRALITARAQIALDQGLTRQRASVWRTNTAARQLMTHLGLTRTRGFREPLTGVMVDHYEGPLPA